MRGYQLAILQNGSYCREMCSDPENDITGGKCCKKGHVFSIPRKCCVKVRLCLWTGNCRTGSDSPVLARNPCWLSSWWISSRQVWSKNNSDRWGYSDNTPIIFSRVFSELLDFCHPKVIEINLLLRSNYFVLMKIYVSGSAHA